MRRIAGLVGWLLLGVGLAASASAQSTGAVGAGGPQGRAGGRPAGSAGQVPPPAVPAAVPGQGGQLVAPNRHTNSTAAPKPLDPEAQAQIDAILAKWEQASANIKTLYAVFEQVDKLALVGVEKKYNGKAYLQRPNLALLQLDKEDKEKQTFVFDRRIVSTGREVLEYDAAARQVTVFPLPEDAQQRALEEGPLPFLFNMKVDAFKKRYHAYLKQSTEKSYRIVIQPLQAIDRDAFHMAVLDLNRERLLPDAIYTLSANGKDQQNYFIKELRINETFDPGLFVWDSTKRKDVTQKGWRVIVNPGPGESQTELEPIGANTGEAAPGTRGTPRR